MRQQLGPNQGHLPVCAAVHPLRVSNPLVSFVCALAAGLALLPGVAVSQSVNEAPSFPGATATRSIAENHADGAKVGAPVAATDPEGDTLSYTLGGTDQASFTIDSTARSR